MISIYNIVALLVLVTVATQVTAAPSLMPTVCTADEEAGAPCVCCKKACWFGIAEMATAYFGHMPGERSDAESRFTLGMMKHCFNTECSDVCGAH